MTVAPGLEGLFACPVCGQRTQLVLAETNAPSEMDFNKLLASQGAESLAGRFGLVQEGAIYYTPAAETSEYVKFPELREFLHEYVRRYEAADAATFIELWAEDAVQDTDSLLLQQNQGQNSRVMILRNYSRLFHRIGPNRYQLTVTALSGRPDPVRDRRGLPDRLPGPGRPTGLLCRGNSSRNRPQPRSTP